jgi:ataxin-10
VIANMSHRRKDIQELIHGTGGVFLILNYCQADISSPLAREWALWAIRNICEGSKEAREAIAELQKLGVEKNTQFDKAGLSVVYDEESNRLRIKKL